MRPALQSAAHAAGEPSPLAPGPWDEERCWLYGIDALSAQPAQQAAAPRDLNANQGGFYTTHSSESWMMLRAAHFTSRPSHSDQLHVDLWWRGVNILCDAGTCSYNPARDFSTSFCSTRHHNTVTIDGLDPMTRLSRFLWTDWAQATVRRSRRAASPCVLEAVHTGYACGEKAHSLAQERARARLQSGSTSPFPNAGFRPWGAFWAGSIPFQHFLRSIDQRVGVVHRRAVTAVGEDTWVAIDDLAGTGHHQARLHWLLAHGTISLVSPHTMDCTFEAGPARLFVASSAPSQIDCVSAGRRVFGPEDPPPEFTRGWISRYYAHKQPALSISAQTSSSLPLRFITVAALGSSPQIAVDASFRHLRVADRDIYLPPIGQCPIFPDRDATN
jgi:hypothetical protein